MKKIAIIGAGQLGSRHLQAVAKSKINISIEVVEPFESSRSTAKERYEQIESTYVSDISFYDSIDKLSDEIDLVIVATGSDVRAAVVKELLTKKVVNNLVLEKVLFQDVEAYSTIKELLEERNTVCWVNHPKRMYPFYQALKNSLKGATQISYSFQGGDSGLGCNALHHIDTFSYLTGESDFSVESECLDKTIYESNRKGFIEFYGLMSGKLGKHPFSLYSNGQSAPEVLSITSDILVVKIDESRGIYQLAKKENDWKWETHEEKIVYYQSELSNVLLEDILVKEKCDLPTYEEAMNLHIPFIESLLTHMDQINGKKNTLCPIT